MDEHSRADQRREPGNTAQDDRQYLLGAVGYAKRVKDLDRGQEADEVTEENHQDTEVEEHRSPN